MVRSLFRVLRASEVLPAIYLTSAAIVIALVRYLVTLLALPAYAVVLLVLLVVGLFGLLLVRGR